MLGTLFCDRSLRFPAFCNEPGERRSQRGETVSALLDTRVPECTCYIIVKTIVDDHLSFTTTPNVILRVVVK